MISGIIFYSCLVLCLVQIGSNTAFLVCNTCNGSESLDQCKDVMRCGDKQSCFTRIETEDEKETYTMGCTDNKNCGEFPKYSESSKLQASPVEQCYECCSSKRCNYHLCQQQKPSKCRDDKLMDCARLNELFDVCKDIHNAKVICRNFCNLCQLVDGNWADWSLWSSCDVSCGNGKHTRTRTCTNPAPAYQGLDCQGDRIDTKQCDRPLCPVHGGWSTWSNWNACPVTCGLGIQKRYRNCSNPYPLRFGDHCFGDQNEFRNCFPKVCDDGVWGSWERWGACFPSCDNGLRKRSRSCGSSAGTICKGEALDVRLCSKTHSCLTACTPKPVYSTNIRNVALGKKVTLSSINKHYVGKYMVDGNYSNFAHTIVEENPFAVIDLGRIYTIYSIVVVNRNCCPNRIRSIVIQVGLASNMLSTVARHPNPLALGAVCTLRLENPFRGRYVKIMLETTECFDLAEVEVYGHK